MMKRSKIFNGEILLPEPMIQHIQSFLTGKEAARTSVLSKSWHTAWLTRPTFDFDQRDFNVCDVQFPKIGFAEVTTKTMQRYHDSNMTIDSFRLRRTHSSEILTNTLILSALERGATELDLDLDASSAAFVLPREVLESEHLLRLSLSRCTIDGNMRCWGLKSLSLHSVHLASDDMIRDVLSCCLLLEELSLSFCTRPNKHGVKPIDLSGMNMFKLHRLRRLFLEKLLYDPLFFRDFGSRFPCLKDLSVSECCCYRWSVTIRIASTSLESMSFVKVDIGLRAKFDVPNLVSFRYSGEGIPILSIATSREWESDVSITTIRNARKHWHLWLEKLLHQLRLSKISLCISRRDLMEGGKDIRAASKPVVVENLTIDPPYHSGYTILSGLLSICRPKFLTIYWHPRCPKENNLCKRLMKELITPNCEISDQNMFGRLGLKEASMKVFEENLEEPRHALKTQEYKRRFRFQLRWG